MTQGKEAASEYLPNPEQRARNRETFFKLSEAILGAQVSDDEEYFTSGNGYIKKVVMGEKSSQRLLEISLLEREESLYSSIIPQSLSGIRFPLIAVNEVIFGDEQTSSYIKTPYGSAIGLSVDTNNTLFMFDNIYIIDWTGNAARCDIITNMNDNSGEYDRSKFGIIERVMSEDDERIVGFEPDDYETLERLVSPLLNNLPFTFLHIS